MKKQEFWKQVERRTRENRVITAGGMPEGWAPVMEKVGLHFWKIGLVISLGIAGWLWLVHYQNVMQAVRVMVWR